MEKEGVANANLDKTRGVFFVNTTMIFNKFSICNGFVKEIPTGFEAFSR